MSLSTTKKDNIMNNINDTTSLRKNIIELLSNGRSHLVTFIKSNGDTVTYECTRNYEFVKSISKAVAFVEPKGAENREANDARLGLITVYKLSGKREDKGFRRIKVANILRIDNFQL